MLPLLRSLDAGVLTLTLNRPAQRNALTRELIEALYEALDHAELNADVRVVALRGAGEHFCVGTDADELAIAATLAENERAALRFGALLQRFRELPKPMVGVIHGSAFGAGAGLAMACDIAIAGERAELGYPEVQRGTLPAIAMALLHRLAGSQLASDLILTGRTLSATEAVAAGLLARAEPDAVLEQAAQAVLQKLVSAPRHTLALAKRLLRDLGDRPFSEALALAARAEALGQSHFDTALSKFLRV